MKNYAVINSKNIVENIVVLDDANDWRAGSLVCLIENDCGIGWKYNDGIFTAPPEPELTHDESVTLADMEKSNLLSVAQQTISIWQTELQLSLITDTDKAQLINWLAYIKKLNMIDTSTAPDIEWPIKPV